MPSTSTIFLPVLSGTDFLALNSVPTENARAAPINH